MIGVDVQRIRRTLGLKGEKRSAELPDPDPRAARAAPGVRAPRAARARAPADRAHAGAAARQAAARARPRAAVEPRPGPRAGAPHGGPAEAAARHAGPRAARPAALVAGGRAPHDARLAPDRRRAARPEVPPAPPAAARAVRALRRVHERHERSVFFLSVLHALHDQFRKLRSFVFVERISEVTDVFERERSFAAVSRRDRHRRRRGRRVRLHRLRARLARVPRQGRGRPRPALDRDRARRRPHERPRAARRRCSATWPSAPGRTFWINPEPRLYWNYGDSVMSAYEPYCDGVFECWTTKQLEAFVNALADLRAVAVDARLGHSQQGGSRRRAEMALRRPAPTLRTCGVMPAEGAMRTEAEAPATEPLSLANVTRAVPERSRRSQGIDLTARAGRGAGRGRAVRLREVDAARADGRASRSPTRASCPSRARATRPRAAPPAPTCPSATCSCPGATRSATPRSRSSARACARAEARRRAEPLFERFGLAEFERGAAGASCPAGCASAWPSCARSSRAAPCCCSTSPSARSTRSRAPSMQSWLAEALGAGAAHRAARDPRRGGGGLPRRPRGRAVAAARAGWWPRSTWSSPGPRDGDAAPDFAAVKRRALEALAA